MNTTKQTATPNKVVKVSKSRRINEADLVNKYPQAIPGTLEFVAAANKQSVEIRCTTSGCTNTRRVYTSDLHQTKFCNSCKK